MTIEELKTAVKNLSVYLEECHGERDTVTFTVKVVRSIKANYEELIKYKENYEDLINRQQAEIEELKADKIIAERKEKDARALFKENVKSNSEVIKAQADKIFLYEKVIKEKSAEIEKLKEEIRILQYCNNVNISSSAELHDRLRTAKSEAIKEFAERLKEKATQIKENAFKGCYVISNANIDNLAKEMTENITKIEHNSLCETETYKGGE